MHDPEDWFPYNLANGIRSKWVLDRVFVTTPIGTLPLSDYGMMGGKAKTIGHERNDFRHLNTLEKTTARGNTAKTRMELDRVERKAIVFGSLSLDSINSHIANQWAIYLLEKRNLEQYLKGHIKGLSLMSDDELNTYINCASIHVNSIGGNFTLPSKLATEKYFLALEEKTKRRQLKKGEGNER